MPHWLVVAGIIILVIAVIALVIWLDIPEVLFMFFDD